MRGAHARGITTPYNALMHIYLQELARLERKAKRLLPEFKREIDTILFWKERQHLVVEKIKVMCIRPWIQSHICIQTICNIQTIFGTRTHTFL